MIEWLSTATPIPNGALVAIVGLACAMFVLGEVAVRDVRRRLRKSMAKWEEVSAMYQKMTALDPKDPSP